MNVSGKKILVMGLGRFGGGLGVTRWLLEQGAEVLLTDVLQEDDLSVQLQQLGEHRKLECVFGGHREYDFVDVDLVIANPAVKMPWDNKYLLAAWNGGVPITTEVRLVVEQLNRNQVIGVTGSAGKSTTASLIYAALKESSVPSLLGGNLGGSILQSLNQIDENTIIVLELSSAMLWWLGDEHEEGWSPHVGVLTNIFPNHLDWHRTMKSYVSCKENMFKFQRAGDVSIRSQEIDLTCDQLSILGKHNQRNASAALAAALAVGAEKRKSLKGISNFKGLPHRLEKVGDFYYNDSKATTPQATQLAVDSFDDPTKIHLIAGGYDKKVDLSLIGQQASRIAGLYAIGQSATTILDSVSGGHAEHCKTLEKAFWAARKRMQEGDILLLSPGCASFDQFEHYERRGDLFRELSHC